MVLGCFKNAGSCRAADFLAIDGQCDGFQRKDSFRSKLE
jgi:hypothetical protein